MFDISIPRLAKIMVKQFYIARTWEPPEAVLDGNESVYYREKNSSSFDSLFLLPDGNNYGPGTLKKRPLILSVESV